MHKLFFITFFIYVSLAQAGEDSLFQKIDSLSSKQDTIDIHQKLFNRGLKLVSMSRAVKWGTDYNVYCLRDAVKHFKAAFRLYPNKYLESHYALGVAYFELGENEEAIKEFELSLPEEKPFFGHLHKLGLSYAIVGDFHKALKMISMLEDQGEYALADEIAQTIAYRRWLIEKMRREKGNN